MKILGKRLLVQDITPRQTGTIHIPETVIDHYRDRPRLFRVLAVGTKPVEARVGERVLCHSHTANPYPLEDGRMIIGEDQIIAILREAG